GTFGNDSLLELITRRAVNDPAHKSALESALDGRDDTYLATFPDSTSFGPLRSNRALDVEHDQRYAFSTTTPINFNPGFAYDRTMLHFAADIRQRLTTISGGRNFRSQTYHAVVNGAGAAATMGQVAGVFTDHLDTSELRV